MLQMTGDETGSLKSDAWGDRWFQWDGAAPSLLAFAVADQT